MVPVIYFWMAISGKQNKRENKIEGKYNCYVCVWGGRKKSSLHERKDVAPGEMREVKQDWSWGEIVPHLNQIRSFSGRRRQKVPFGLRKLTYFKNIVFNTHKNVAFKLTSENVIRKEQQHIGLLSHRMWKQNVWSKLFRNLQWKLWWTKQHLQQCLWILSFRVC